MGRIMKATRLGLEAAGVLLLGEDGLGKERRAGRRLGRSSPPSKSRRNRSGLRARSRRAMRKTGRKLERAGSK